MPQLRDLDTELISPYLRQHVDNPVDWYEWGEDAFAAARERDVPILLSIGYSSCHWCHVMAHESFENADIAATMNANFVNVKVDREERPDVDTIYMEAVQRLTGRGGWPLTAFLTPDGEPFYAGTYFPPADRQGMPGFPRVLTAMDDVWRNRRDDVLQNAAALRHAIATEELSPEPHELTAADLDAAAERAAAGADLELGGFGGAPNFPQAMTIEFLWHTYVHTGNVALRRAATVALDRMAGGGIHDQLGGGFHRYSVDARWLVPHFEKMLYDQATLLRAYTAGWLVTRAAPWRTVAEAIVTYVLRDLRHGNGGFFSAEDADSEGQEGRFYVWSRDELRAALSTLDTAAVEEIEAWFGVGDEGNFVDPTGHAPPRTNILHRPVDDERDEEPESVRTARELLLAARAQRVRPGLDDKVLLAWNAQFLRSLVEAAVAFDRPDWMEAARTNAHFLLATFRDNDGRLLRSWQPGGTARHRAYAEDHGALAGALISLAEYDDLAWLDDARGVLDHLIEHYRAPDGGWYTTADDAETLIVRTRDLLDNAMPGATSLAADALLRYAAISGDDAYAVPARHIVGTLADSALRHPSALANLLLAAERVVFAPIECAVIGSDAQLATAATADLAGADLAQTFTRQLIPASVFVRSPGPDDRTPLLADRHTLGGAPTAYVCERYACQAPTTDAGELDRQLREALARRNS